MCFYIKNNLKKRWLVDALDRFFWSITMYIPALKQALYEVILDSGIQQRFKDQSVAKVIKQKRNTQF